MNVRRKRRYLVLAAAGSLVWALSAGLPAAHAAGPAGPAGTGALVSVASPPNVAVRNGQNEPALAVDPTHPNILAAGGNDLVTRSPARSRRRPRPGLAISRGEPTPSGSA